MTYLARRFRSSPAPAFAARERPRSDGRSRSDHDARRAGPDRRVRAGLAAALVGLGLAGCVSATTGSVDLVDRAEARAPGPAGEDLLIPFAAAGVPMHATFYRPAGAGPFRLAVINHGSNEADATARIAMPMPTFPVLTQWLLAHGYAVLVPERPGHGITGGPYLEDQGACDQPDYVTSGKRTADAIAAAIAYAMHTEGASLRGKAVVIGNSAGGWGALALAARNPADVGSVINFAGGRGGHDRGRAFHNCSPDRLVAAAGTFGRTARVPTLWLYAENDSYFPPDLSRRMAAAFAAGGGKVDYRLLPPVGREGHALIEAPLSVAPWPPIVARFLARNGELDAARPTR